MNQPSKNDRILARARRAQRLISPVTRFTQLEASSGIVLIVCTIVALILANSPLSETYFGIIETKVGLSFGEHKLALTVGHWINDLLMAVFFLVVGLEIKRELLLGELSSFRQAALPIMAAIGGMVVPAGMYLAFNMGGDGLRGWGIPMATDIAFSLGILALVGSRVPVFLKIFLTALAIVDDLGAVLVIAVAYTEKIDMSALGVAGLFLIALMGLNLYGVRKLLPYMLLGIGLWTGFLFSGIHATIAGVLLALTVPVWVRIDAQTFVQRSRELINEVERGDDRQGSVLISEDRQSHIEEIERNCERVQMPLQRLEHAAHPWVTYLIVPVFAIANAGVHIPPDILSQLSSAIPLGVIAGLVLGKPIGIVLLSLIAVKSGMAALPPKVNWFHITGLGFIAGIGFTMSMFIANLAFRDPDKIDAAKAGILVGSLLAGVIGFVLLRMGQSLKLKKKSARA